MKDPEEVTIPGVSLVVIGVLWLAAGSQFAFTRTSFNVPHAALLKFLNQTYCPDRHKVDGCGWWFLGKETFLTYLWTMVVAATFFGEIPAILAARWFCDHFGRRGVLFWSGVCCLLGLALQGVSEPMEQISLLAIGRFVHGLGTGFMFISSFLFIHEVSHKRLRRIPTFPGILCLPFIQLLGIQPILGGARWPFLCIIPGGAIVLLLFTVLSIPESPKYLHRIKADESLIVRSLVFYQGPSVWPQEYLDECIREEPLRTGVKRGFAAITESWQKGSVHRSNVLVVLVSGMMQCFGFSIVLTMFSTEILEQGLHLNPKLAITVTICSFAAAAFVLGVSTPFDKVISRRACLLASLGVIIFGFMGLAGVAFGLQYLQFLPDQIRFVSIGFWLLVLVAFSCGLARMPWFLAAENLSPTARLPTYTLALVLGFTLDGIHTGVFLFFFRQFGLSWALLPLLNILILGFVYLAFACPYYELRKKLPKRSNPTFKFDDLSAEDDSKRKKIRLKIPKIHGHRGAQKKRKKKTEDPATESRGRSASPRPVPPPTSQELDAVSVRSRSISPRPILFQPQERAVDRSAGRSPESSSLDSSPRPTRGRRVQPSKGHFPRSRSPHFFP